jgi:Leucine-rich repeat (LRR) protein
MRYDAFLSYNTNDQATVKAIALYLKNEAGMKVFFDLWEMVPGTPVQEALEKALADSGVYVIFIGPTGLGIYQNEEARIALEKSISKKDLRVIPVLLSGGKRETRESELPPFLRRLSWVEFGADLLDPEALRLLVCGIKNISPGPGVNALGDRQSSIGMAEDIKIIEQIEKQIGEKLKPLPLKYLKNIMNLGNNGYVLNHVKQVQGLNLDGKKVEDISFLRDLGGLTHLSLANNQITDLTPLCTLTNLRNLELRNNKIEDITPLAALTHLERLILINTGISDISPLSGLVDINTLSLSFNKIIDLSPLIPLTSLTSLQLNKNKINDLTPLSALTQLEILGVRINRITDLTPLKELINLKGLNVSRNNITKLPPDIYRWRWWSSMEISPDDDDTTDKGFYLFGNPLIDPPVDIVKQGKAAVKNYFDITPGFENDIFISYCHYDNAAPPNENGWVDRFHESIESLLTRYFGPKKVSIWRDKKLQGSTLFDERIQEQIRKSAIFFVLLSPNYLKSEYCSKELEWFYREAEKSRYGLSVNNEYRIFNVLLRNIPHSQWPKQLKGTSGFPMHDQKEGSKNLGAFLDYQCW